MNIYLIRHGETDWNLIGKVQGREDIPLNETGRKQAKKCASALQNTDIKTIISSPLIRAVETANIISNSTNSAARLIIDDGLIERDFGDMSGMTYDRRKYFDTFGYEETMEPLDKLSKRLIDCIHKYARKFKGQDIVMVSHGAAINSVITVLSEGEEGSGKTRLKNACISILTYEDSELKLGSFNLSPGEFMNAMFQDS
ncbi:MAG: histidine phosphatase family protein [Anaerolineaceae bacterium]|nr:MAG: histidine phosphatase family protein [Anaerolineaceae bacterium]